jgi:hypothetical protein
VLFQSRMTSRVQSRTTGSNDGRRAEAGAENVSASVSMAMRPVTTLR